MGLPVVMVVDDDPPALAVMGRVLSSDLYQIVTAASGEQALDLIKGLLGTSVKLMLLDLSLTDMSGLTLADEARKILPDVKVLYVSGYNPSDDEQAKNWISKPFELDDLRARIHVELFGE